MDESQTLLPAIVHGELSCFLDACSAFDHGRAVPARVLDLYGRRSQGDHDGCRYFEARGVMGHALRVVAGRTGDHPSPPFIDRQSRQAIERAALLEGRGELQVFEFEPHAGAGDVGQRAAALETGPPDEARQHACRRPDVGKRDRQLRQRCCKRLTHRH